MNEVHQLTYTLENAPDSINKETTALTDTLEEVHIASEINRPDGRSPRPRNTMTEKCSCRSGIVMS